MGRGCASVLKTHWSKEISSSSLNNKYKYCKERKYRLPNDLDYLVFLILLLIKAPMRTIGFNWRQSSNLGKGKRRPLFTFLSEWNMAVVNSRNEMSPHFSYYTIYICKMECRYSRTFFNVNANLEIKFANSVQFKRAFSKPLSICTKVENELWKFLQIFCF